MLTLARLAVGSLAGGLAMMLAGFVFWATPLSSLAYANTNGTADNEIEHLLARALPHSGRYVIVSPATAEGPDRDSSGPIAQIDYNREGATEGPGKMLAGFALQVWTSSLIWLLLASVATRVTDLFSRVRLVTGFALACAGMVRLNDPVFIHTGWTYSVYALAADVAMLCASGLVIARWFLPGQGQRDPGNERSGMIG